MTVLTEAEVPEKNKKRAVAQSGKLRKKRKGLTKAKACKIAADDEVRGRKLTRKQQKMFHARCDHE